MLAVLTEGDARGEGVVQEAASSLSQLSTQTVFSMMSHLTQWSRHVLYSKSKNNGKMPHLVLYENDLIDSSQQFAVGQLVHLLMSVCQLFTTCRQCKFKL